ncbi:hypothetical protein A5645_16505 [Mycobacterium asiaticum]|uniref:hypothetical protein n=1 Tax=Mycobacterium asiaticum TaxID=1790 RepID=UPI0007EF333F|nr:hypothetical protein [Mycobacterium asiaticum]OBK94359.1 hypothetical protein A5645_16505 [Mycobacterium asiaticum]
MTGSAGEGHAEDKYFAERTARVERRVEELRQRRAELAAGRRPTLESAILAQQRAEAALERAREAHLAAAHRHEELARIHEQTANIYQRAAIRGDDGPRYLLQQKADEHWQAAHDSHLRQAEDEAKAREDERH